MPLTSSEATFSIKLRLLIKALLLCTVIFIACLNIYIGERDLRRSLGNIDLLRYQQVSLNSLYESTEDIIAVYTDSLKNIDNLTSDKFEQSFKNLEDRLFAVTDLPSSIVQEIRENLLDDRKAINEARTQLSLGHVDEARNIFFKNYDHISQMHNDLKEYSEKLGAKYSHTRIEVRGQVLANPYRQLWILVGCLAFILILGMTLLVDILIPIKNITDHIVLASKDTPNATRHLFKKLRKDELGVVQHSFNNLLIEVEDNIQKSRKSEAISQNRLVAIEAARDGIGIIDKDGNLIFSNQALMDLHGIKAEDANNYIGHPWKNIYSDGGQSEVEFEIIPTVKRQGFWRGEFSLEGKNGKIIFADMSLSLLPDGGMVGTARDVSDRVATELEKEQLQSQIIQVQKLDAVGRLTGGIAHDFNNMLTIINGNLDMASDFVEENSEATKFLQITRRAVLRGSELTQRLLAFSRSQSLNPKVVNLNTIIPEATMMIIRAIGEQVEIIFNLAEDLGDVKLDIGQFEGALVNLSINARDAMPDGGYIKIKTKNIDLHEGVPLFKDDMVRGEYIMVEVTDNGSGIPDDVLPQIFDPFFTTKAIGEGSGLGLSMVYGFVKQSDGHIDVESKVGIGTSIRLLFPRFGKTDTDRPADENSIIPEITSIKTLTGTETILLVEDEKEILELNKSILVKLGYTVHCAPNGNEALFMARQIDHIDLLISDIVMPGNLNGYALAKQMKGIFPEAKVLFISGYAPLQSAKTGAMVDNINLLSKPYLSQQFAERVRMTLDEPDKAQV